VVTSSAYAATAAGECVIGEGGGEQHGYRCRSDENSTEHSALLLRKRKAADICTSPEPRACRSFARQSLTTLTWIKSHGSICGGQQFHHPLPRGMLPALAI
jgi:hypothetical protein